MNRKTMILLFSAICITGLVSCGNNVGSNGENTYTVTWKNYDGSILEVDNNVEYGTMPSYDGAEPTRIGDAQNSYTFSGWTPELIPVISDVTYTAKFTSSTNTYTVTWKNYDGSILEVDDDVLYGTIPTYDGTTPKKDDNGDIRYIFTGWTPSISEVVENTTYTATFTEIRDGEFTPGIDPIISSDNKTIQYGIYPQTHVNDETLIAELNTLTSSEINGWYLYNGEYYIKEVAKVYNNENYAFDDGTTIVEGNEYWFKCEIIEWNILSDNSGVYFLLSSKLLDAHDYYSNYSNRTINSKTIYANNYEQSNIRTWLNEDFYNAAFRFNNSYIQEITVDNSDLTTDASDGNKYSCNDTKDKVYLPSYQDYLNLNYGFDSDASRESKTTDYARARGAWCNTRDASNPRLKQNGSYWTRSPSSEYYYCAWNVNSGGYLSTYGVDGDSHCVRPSISICFA